MQQKALATKGKNALTSCGLLHFALKTARSGDSSFLLLAVGQSGEEFGQDRIALAVIVEEFLEEPADAVHLRPGD